MKFLKYSTNTKTLLISSVILLVLLFVISCKNEAFSTVENIDNVISSLPEYTKVPENNSMTPEKISLGKQLFWDPILSGSKDVACATCHHPEKGYADALDLSIGVEGFGLGELRRGNIFAKRNAHTVINTAFNGITIDNEVNSLNAPMFWDNRAQSLEVQALLPLLSKEEMKGDIIPENDLYDTIVNRLNDIEAYRLAFLKAFGTEEINTNRIAKAIASFERTLIARNSPFDLYMRGNSTAMTQQQINGMNAFVNIGCAECHSGPMFSDFKLHVLGVPDNSKLTNTDTGNGNYAFRTPTLRNLKFTAPYMHNGIQSSLQEVMNFYENVAQGGGENGNVINQKLKTNQIDPLARNLQIDDDVNESIIAFLNALNDGVFDKTIPKNVPSRLTVGGNIN